jgi:hypothetical protein
MNKSIIRFIVSLFMLTVVQFSSIGLSAANAHNITSTKIAATKTVKCTENKNQNINSIVKIIDENECCTNVSHGHNNIIDFSTNISPKNQFNHQAYSIIFAKYINLYKFTYTNNLFKPPRFIA